MHGVTRVVAGTSGSPGSLVALRYAENLARAHDAILVPLLAWGPPGDRDELVHPYGQLLDEWRDMARQQMREALVAVWGQVPTDPRVWPRVERGTAGLVLVSVACHPGDVLVLGAGRRGPLHRIAGCRVSRYCATRARCPVLLVPPPELSRETGLRRIAWHLAHRTVTAEQILGNRGQPAAI